MNQKNQSDIDSLLEQMEQGSAGVAVEQITGDDSASSEDTGESSSGQAEVDAAFSAAETSSGMDNSPETGKNSEKTSDPRGVPWVNFVPEMDIIHPQTLQEHLAQEQDNLNDRLKEKELLKVSFLDRGAHKSYYRVWVRDCNLLFGALVRTRYRKLAEETGDQYWEC